MRVNHECISKEFKLKQKEKAVSYVDITQSVKDTILESGIQSGTCTVVTAIRHVLFSKKIHMIEMKTEWIFTIRFESNLKYSSAPYKCAKLQLSGEAHYKRSRIMA